MPSTGFPHHPAFRLIEEARAGDLLRLDAGAIVDGQGADFAPGSLLLCVNRTGLAGLPCAIEADVVGLDAPAQIDAHPLAASATRVDLSDSILIPGLVNAHAHLDLTHIGPLPHDPDEGFVGWIDHVRRHRALESEQIEASVREGVALSLAGGTVAVGDIAGAPEGRPSLAAYRALRESPLLGVSFLEFFAIGMRERESLAAIDRVLDEGLAMARPADGVRLGLQPHAPYSASLAAYRWAQEMAGKHRIAVATHLAETAEEREFVQHARGPKREFLESLGLWDESLLEHVGRGLEPVGYLAEILAMGPIACAHGNDVDDAGIDTLSRHRASVIYCPRASSYFGADRVFGPHRYRDMLESGVNVALGTDSIANLPPESRESDHGISIWDEMRLLHARDGTDPRSLLAMATTGGATALGLDPARFRFQAGSMLAGIARIGLDSKQGKHPLQIALESDAGIDLLFHGNSSGLTGKAGG